MIFYVSTRPIVVGRQLITPKEHFKKNFKGLNFEFELVCWNKDLDGRMLYKIKLADDYSDNEKSELKDMFIESLSMFSVHEKSLESAKALAEKLVGDAGSVEIEDDHLKITRID